MSSDPAKAEESQPVLAGAFLTPAGAAKGKQREREPAPLRRLPRRSGAWRRQPSKSTERPWVARAATHHQPHSPARRVECRQLAHAAGVGWVLLHEPKIHVLPVNPLPSQSTGGSEEPAHRPFSRELHGKPSGNLLMPARIHSACSCS